MISNHVKTSMPSMKRLPFFALALVSVPLVAQEPAPLTTPAAPVLLAPPKDEAPSIMETPGAVSKPSEVATPPPTPVTTGSRPASTSSPSQVARIQQQEIIRRQELTFRASKALTDATKAERGSNWASARNNYLFAAEAFGSISRSTSSYATAAEGLTRVDFHLYDDALKTGDTGRAKLLIDEVLKYNPNNMAAAEKQAAINRAIANPNDTSLFGNAALTPALVKKVQEVQQLFAEAEQFRRTGQWDQAENRLRRIIAIDHYNITATKQLQKIDEQKNEYAEKARMQTRDERLRQVEEKWYEEIDNKDSNLATIEIQPALIRNSTFNIDQQLRSIFLSLNFDNATIEGATNFLSLESKRLDPNHKGINFIIQPLASSSAKPISLTLNNVPLEVALRYVCQLANVKYKVQDYAISIIPFNGSTDDLISRTFVVQPSFVVPPAGASTIGSVTSSMSGARPTLPVAGAPASGAPDTGDPVRRALEAKGVKFPPGASVVYTASTGQLTVVNTADQMELIEELVNAGVAPTLMVKIATKFVEINQDDLNDLTINSAFNFLNPQSRGDSSANYISIPSAHTALQGARGFAPNSIDQLIAPQATNFNSLFIKSFINGYQLNVVVDALSQKKSYDLLSDPFVLAKSGEQGVIEAVRVFPYPIAFDPPQLVTQQQTTGANTTVTGVVASSPPAVIATTPTDFKKRNVGVRLVIKPQVTADNKTVDLSLFPEVTDFQGFINYGSPIFVGNADGSRSLLSLNEINQPVFNTRRINTKVLIRDGSTVVLGGLIREDLQSITDKVPGLGDLPLVGRLFQSKAMKNTKRNLIIFVTANIYRNDGELLNPPVEVNAAEVLTSHASFSAPTSVQ